MNNGRQYAGHFVFLTMLFNHRYRYLFVAALAIYAFLNTVICRVYFYFHLLIPLYDAFIVILLLTAGIWEANRLIYPLINKWVPASRDIIKHTILFFICGFAAGALLTVLVDVFFGFVVLKQDAASIVNPLKMTLTYTGLVNLLYHLLNTIFVYQQEYRKKIIESEGLKRMHAQAELFAIRQQINPHFLFNNLNVLSGLVMQKSNDANKFIEAFSQVYMHILNNHNKELIELRKELDFLEPYLFLLTQRFPDALQLEVNVGEKYKHTFIIPVALQMLVENAIKHNILSDKKPLRLSIFTDENGTLTVMNNYQPKFTKEHSTHSGLHNIQKRYELATGKQITILQEEKRFSVTLPLIEINTYESINY